MDNLKAEQLTGSKWRVLAIPFGGPKNGKDLDGEFFDAETDIKPHWFKARPVLVHHGQDATAKDEDYGEQELDLEAGPDGWWSTVWLNRSARYWEMVDKWLRAGKMYGSSGAIAHLVRKAANGHIEVWPHAEQTLTPTPANPFARITASKALTGFDLAGIELSDTVKSLLEELDRPVTADLPTDLPRPAQAATGGDDAAMTRQAIALGRLLNLQRRAEDI